MDVVEETQQSLSDVCTGPGASHRQLNFGEIIRMSTNTHENYDNILDFDAGRMLMKETNNTSTGNPIFTVVDLNNLNSGSPEIDTRIIFEDSLDNFLSNDYEGKFLKLAFQKNERLSDNNQSVLVRLVINREREKALMEQGGQEMKEFKITPQRFEFLAKEIARIFQEDELIYYQKYRRVGDKKILACGKLLDRYQHVKKNLILEGILLRPAPKNRKLQLDADDEETGEVSSGNSQCEEDDKFLKDHPIPTNTDLELARQCWARTFDLRRKLLMKERLPVGQYFERYKNLLESELIGPILIEEDFERLKPGCKFTENWETYRNRIFDLELESNALKKNIQYLKLITKFSEFKAEQKDALIIFFLPLILKRVTRVGKKSLEVSPQQPSICEIVESFIIHIPNASDIAEVLRTRNRMHGFPLMIFVGPLEQFTSFYIVVENSSYMVNSATKALNLTFKIFYAIDIEYPEVARNIWLLVQKVLYGFEEPHDKFGTQLKVQISKILKKTSNSK